MRQLVGGLQPRRFVAIAEQIGHRRAGRDRKRIGEEAGDPVAAHALADGREVRAGSPICHRRSWLLQVALHAAQLAEQHQPTRPSRQPWLRKPRDDGRQRGARRLPFRASGHHERERERDAAWSVLRTSGPWQRISERRAAIASDGLDSWSSATRHHAGSG